MPRSLPPAMLFSILLAAAPCAAGQVPERPVASFAPQPQLLASALERYDPELRLDDRELIRLVDCVAEMRRSVHVLRSLPKNAETLWPRTESRQRLYAALETFRKTTGLSGEDLAELIGSTEGLDNGRPETGPVTFRRLNAALPPRSEPWR